MDEAKTAFGRQVLFVNPSYLVKTFIIQKLIEMEYEVYYVDNLRFVKGILNRFPRAMCLIEVDSSMSLEGFSNFIGSIERTPEYADVQVGVLSKRIASLQRKFSDDLTISAGFVNTAANKEAILDELARLFNTFEVKGRRQFVRVSLTNSSRASFYCKINEIPTHFQLRDISTCGFACETTTFPESAFTPNALISGELQLGDSILPCSVVLFAIKPAGKSLILVMLFTQTNAWSNKKTIRGFVAETLQKTITMIKLSENSDDEDYEQKPEKVEKTDEPENAESVQTEEPESEQS